LLLSRASSSLIDTSNVNKQKGKNTDLKENRLRRFLVPDQGKGYNAVKKSKTIVLEFLTAS
jgi:hypothetical protein